MFSRLLKKLSEGPLLLDGGMAAALSARGFPQSRPPELACLESPELLKEVHTGFRDSGSDVFLTNSFGGNEFRLEKHSLGSNQEEILLSSARIAREVAGSGVLVAGSMGPSGREDLSLQVLEAAFARQAEFLAKGGVDFFFIETMQNPEEAAAAVRGAERSGLEVCVSMCFPSGIPDDSLLAELVQRMEDTGAVAMGANCSPSSHGMPDLISRVSRFSSLPLIAKPSAGLPLMENGKPVYRLSPEDFACDLLRAQDAGASLLGGCCGVEAGHIAELHRQWKHP